MTREELLSRISADEFREWMLLEQIEPFGEQGAYLRAGIIACTLANIHRPKDAPAFKPADFMPIVQEPPKPQTAEQMKAFMEMMRAAQEAAIANG